MENARLRCKFVNAHLDEHVDVSKFNKLFPVKLSRERESLSTHGRCLNNPKLCHPTSPLKAIRRMYMLNDESLLSIE
jgi:hypothetical protein